MVKRASAPSAASSLRSSVVLSRAVEKNFALEAEVSRLRHHVSVLLRRLHRALKENSTPPPRDSQREYRAPPTVIPSPSPTPSVVTVVGGGPDPDTHVREAEELPRRVVTPTVIPSSPPPYVGVGRTGGLSPDWFQDDEAGASSPVEGVEESVAISAAVAPSSEEVPEPLEAEPVAGGVGASSGAAAVAVGGGGGSSAASLPGSVAGKRRKRSKKRRVRYDNTDPVPLVSSSEGQSSSSPERARAVPAVVLATEVEPPVARIPWGAWRCSGPCRASTDGPADAFSSEDPPCDECGGRWELERWY